MFVRSILYAALVAASLAWNPATVAAQERGMDRAAAASANAHATGRPSDLPPGIARNYPNADLPSGIALTRTSPDPEPDVSSDPEPDSGDDECVPTPTIHNGLPALILCDGTIVII